MNQKERPQKPRPIREPRVVGSSIWNVPLDGYVIPRLQKRETDAIGFVHKFSSEEE